MNDNNLFTDDLKGCIFDKNGNFHAENLCVNIDKDGGSRLALPENFDSASVSRIDIPFTSKAYIKGDVDCDKFLSDLDRGMLSGRTSIHCGLRSYIDDKIVQDGYNRILKCPQGMPSSRAVPDSRPRPYADEIIVSLVRNGNNFEIGGSRLEFHGSEAYDAKFTIDDYLDLDEFYPFERDKLVDAAVGAVCDASGLSRDELLDKFEGPNPTATAADRVVHYTMTCGDGAVYDMDCGIVN